MGWSEDILGANMQCLKGTWNPERSVISRASGWGGVRIYQQSQQLRQFKVGNDVQAKMMSSVSIKPWFKHSEE